MNAASGSSSGLPTNVHSSDADRVGGSSSGKSGREKEAKKKDSKKHKKSSKDYKKSKKAKKEKKKHRSRDDDKDEREKRRRGREAEDRSERSGVDRRGDESKRRREHDSEARDRQKRSRADLPTSQPARTYSGYIVPISEDDYFRKSTEFRLWLRLSRNTNFEDLSSSDARDLFADKFVPAHNAGALEEVYYTGDMPASLRREATATQHRWRLNLSDTERDQLADLSDSVDYQTRHAKAENPI